MHPFIAHRARYCSEGMEVRRAGLDMSAKLLRLARFVRKD